MSDTGPANTQQIWPAVQHCWPQHRALEAQSWSVHGVAMHFPFSQNGVGEEHGMLQPPQLSGSVNGSLQVTPLQQWLPSLVQVVGQLPPPEPLLEPEPEPLLEPGLSTDASPPSVDVEPPQSSKDPTMSKAAAGAAIFMNIGMGAS
jgi:hypothetical protein